MGSQVSCFAMLLSLQTSIILPLRSKKKETITISSLIQTLPSISSLSSLIYFYQALLGAQWLTFSANFLRSAINNVGLNVSIVVMSFPYYSGVLVWKCNIPYSTFQRHLSLHACFDTFESIALESPVYFRFTLDLVGSCNWKHGNCNWKQGTYIFTFLYFLRTSVQNRGPLDPRRVISSQRGEQGRNVQIYVNL